MEELKERVKGFEKEFKELLEKYKVLGFCCDWDSMKVGFDNGSDYGKWFALYGKGNGMTVETSKLTFDLED